MKKVFKFMKGIVKGIRDVSPVPSKDSENETGRKNLDKYLAWYELLGQKLSSRGIAVSVLIWALDEIFNLGLFS